jgi:hypothetical protein
MKKINLLRRSLIKTPLSSYRLDLEIMSTEDITKDVFVKQRLRAVDNSIDDRFVAIASPAQIEDLGVNSPNGDSSYFRSSVVSLVSSNPDYLEETFNIILTELQSLTEAIEVLDELTVDGIYNITADEVTTNMSILHTHYRIPLVARPAGINEVYVDDADGERKHRVASPNTSLSGWLPTDVNSPPNTYFRYNIPQDSSLGLVWPIPDNFLPYVHMEFDGVTAKEVIINGDGIFWKSNKFGTVPWPSDFVNVGDPGTAGNQVTLTLDLIK